MACTFVVLGILGALQHDCIMDSSDADYALVQAEADRVAKQAAAHLARSRTDSRDPSQPTWTGMQGTAGAPVVLAKKK